MHRIVALVFVVLAALTCAACDGPDRPAWLSHDPNNLSNRNLSGDPLSLRVTGPVEIDVDSFGGDVIVEGDRLLANAEVTFVREAVHGFWRVEEGLDSLAQINTTARVVRGEMGQRLEVRTRTFHPEPHFQRAHVYLKVPDIDGVRIKTTNGRVWVRNFRGSVDVSNSEGDVKLMSNQTLNRAITVVNRNGDVELRMRGESRGRIDAEVINGKANGFARYGRLMVDAVNGHDVFKATLNGGTNPIMLRTTNGDAYVAVVYDPELATGRMWD